MKKILEWAMFVVVAILFWVAMVNLWGVSPIVAIPCIAWFLMLCYGISIKDPLWMSWFTCALTLLVAFVYYIIPLIGIHADSSKFLWGIDGAFAGTWVVWVILSILGYLAFKKEAKEAPISEDDEEKVTSKDDERPLMLKDIGEIPKFQTFSAVILLLEFAILWLK